MLYLAQNSAVQTKLQAELDAALGSPQSIGDDRDEPMLASHEVVKSLPYLRDVINEGLRLFSTLGIGLPRLVQGDGLTILGRTFAPGTVVSVSTYALHHDKTIWGDDAESFSPDRWEKGNREGLMKAFAPFSTGPRYASLSSGRGASERDTGHAWARTSHSWRCRFLSPPYSIVTKSGRHILRHQ